jgi:bifunctional DNA-binding transcriptional regulator/antitoxin component of YhaV-PrlF toxin-antitoxin module
MQADFVSTIRIANKNGTGFLRIPDESVDLFPPGCNVEIVLDNKSTFLSQIIKWGSVGVYVPKEIARNFFGRKVPINLEKIQDSYAKVGSDGRIYIPLDVAKKLTLRHKDIVRIRVPHGDNAFEAYSEINVRKRGQKIEYMCILRKSLAGESIRFGIEKAIKHNSKGHVAQFLKNTNYAQTAEGNVVVFSRKMPIVINPNIKLQDIALYMGAFYSDGTKVGNNWSICASTFEQARFYLNMHNMLVKAPKLEFVVSYTDTHNEREDFLKGRLGSLWTKNVGKYPYKFRIREPRGKIFSKCTNHGTLVVREHRIAVLEFYNSLLQSLLKEIYRKKDKTLAVDFICGVLEGDGSAGNKERGHVLIASNEKEYHAISQVLDVAGIKHNIRKEDDNKYCIRIGALELLRNFDSLKGKIFALYPKRRYLLFQRLQTVGTVKFLLGQEHEPNGRVKAWLRDNGFVNDTYQLTPKGKKLGASLTKCIRETEAAKSVTVK